MFFAPVSLAPIYSRDVHVTNQPVRTRGSAGFLSTQQSRDDGRLSRALSVVVSTGDMTMGEATAGNCPLMAVFVYVYAPV